MHIAELSRFPQQIQDTERVFLSYAMIAELSLRLCVLVGLDLKSCVLSSHIVSIKMLVVSERKIFFIEKLALRRLRKCPISNRTACHLFLEQRHKGPSSVKKIFRWSCKFYVSSS